MTSQLPCPFCTRILAAEVVLSTGFSAAVPDLFPLNPGHTLVVPKRHVADLFALRSEEQIDLWHLVAEVKTMLDRELAPHAFNIGVNVGVAAGQTVDHAHVHIIPRFKGDVPDPRGGVRWVIPSRAPYWDSR